jgi:hypothetical protein
MYIIKVVAVVGVVVVVVEEEEVVVVAVEVLGSSGLKMMADIMCLFSSYKADVVDGNDCLCEKAGRWEKMMF